MSYNSININDNFIYFSRYCFELVSVFIQQSGRFFCRKQGSHGAVFGLWGDGVCVFAITGRWVNWRTAENCVS